MKIVQFALISLLSFALMTCNENTPQEETPNAEDTTAQASSTLDAEHNEIVENQESEQPDTPSDTIDKSEVIEAIYDHCTAYAGSTDLYFEVPNENEPLVIRVPAEGTEIDEADRIEMPQMLDTSEDIEGPPGANPELVGKKFRIVYGKDGYLKAIELAE